MARSTFRAALAVVVGVLMTACSMMMPPQPPVQLSGTLRSVRPAGGGKPTGWVLSMGEMMGMQGQAQALDVSKVQAQAEALEGKQVMVKAVPTNNSSGQTFVVQEIGEISR